MNDTTDLLQAIEDFKRDNPNYQRAVEIIEQCEPIVRAYAEWQARPYGLYTMSTATPRKITPRGTVPPPLQDPGYLEIVKYSPHHPITLAVIVFWIIVGGLIALALLR